MERWLAYLYAARHSRGDRGNIETPKSQIDHTTGYAVSEAHQLSPGRALLGATFVLQNQFRSHKLALGEIISDDLEVTHCKACNRDHQGIHMFWKSDRDRWSAHEAMVVERVEYFWKRFAVILAGKGLARLERVLVYEGDPTMTDKYKSVMGRDGLPSCWRATPDALELAERTIPGTPLARIPFSYLLAAPDDVQAHAARAVPWAWNAALSEEGAGTS